MTDAATAYIGRNLQLTNHFATGCTGCHTGASAQGRGDEWDAVDAECPRVVDSAASAPARRHLPVV